TIKVQNPRRDDRPRNNTSHCLHQLQRRDWMDRYILNILNQEVSDRFVTQVTQAIHNKFDQLIAMLRPSTDKCPQTWFEIGPSSAKDNTPAASMTSHAIVKTMILVTGADIDTCNVCPNCLCLRQTYGRAHTLILLTS
ncbi:hypothetical protein CHS0354_002997, partial [Potamilus streckersoni]